MKIRPIPHIKARAIVFGDQGYGMGNDVGIVQRLDCSARRERIYAFPTLNETPARR
jgi:hypothetical protein